MLVSVSASLIFAFRQDLAPGARCRAGCCGFSGPFPPPLLISRSYVFNFRKEYGSMAILSTEMLPALQPRSLGLLWHRLRHVLVEDHVDPVLFPAELEVEVVLVCHAGHRLQLPHIPKPEENPVPLSKIVEEAG